MATGKLRKAVGYCTDTDCEDVFKGIFLLNHGDYYYCARCRKLGMMEEENSKVSGFGYKFTECRVEFSFDPLERCYRSVAIVKEEGKEAIQGRTYTLYSPLIKTEKRALKIAEGLLGRLQERREVKDGDIITTTERILLWDEPMDVYKQKLEKLGEKWNDQKI
jgi:hypothetical protein